MQQSARFTLAGLRAATAYALGYAAFTAVNVAHAVIRGNADNAASRSYSAGPLEHAVFHGWPSLWLQRWTPEHDLFMAIAFLIWGSLFYVPLLLCVLALATRGVRGIAGLLALHAVLVLSADVLFALAPTRPPWMDLPLQRVIVDYSGLVLSDSNPLAAVPSLHVAIPVAYAIWFLAQDDRRLRGVGYALAAWSVAMAWAVVFTGEHYVLGSAAGAAWAILVFAGLRAIGVVGGSPIRGRNRVPLSEQTQAAPHVVPPHGSGPVPRRPRHVQADGA